VPPDHRVTTARQRHADGGLYRGDRRQFDHPRRWRHIADQAGPGAGGTAYSTRKVRDAVPCRGITATIPGAFEPDRRPGQPFRGRGRPALGKDLHDPQHRGAAIKPAPRMSGPWPQPRTTSGSWFLREPSDVASTGISLAHPQTVVFGTALVWRRVDEPVSALADRSRTPGRRGGIGRLQQGGTGRAHNNVDTYCYPDVDDGGNGFGDCHLGRVGIISGAVDAVEY